MPLKKHKLYLCSFFIAIWGISCSVHNRANSNDFSRLKIGFKMPLKFIQEKPIGDTDFFFVSYFKNYTLYEISTRTELQINNKVVYTDSLVYHYFIQKRNSNYGFVLKNLEDSFSNKVDADSFLLHQAMKGGRGHSIELPLSEFIKFKKVREENGSEIYLQILEPNENYDSLEMVCKKSLKNIPFSWSSLIDSATNSKLCNFNLYLKVPRDKLPFKEFFVNRFELETAPVDNEKELRELFQRFEKKTAIE
jgi:hypothetical protein